MDYQHVLLPNIEIKNGMNKWLKPLAIISHLKTHG
jgi:hypothetical protein